MDGKSDLPEMILVDKPAGMSSFGVVARVRRVLSERAGKKVKVGHTGTLDPFATGLLILMAGKGTKRCQEFLKLDKRYEATIRLGQVSNTGDVEGEVRDYFCSSPRSSRPSSRGSGAIPRQQPAECAEQKQSLTSPTLPTLAQVREVVEGFVGEVEQTVPAYSAVKINGRRAYDLARKGQVVEMPRRRVQIYEIKILDYQWPELKIACHVSSGTYIRALGQDIGEQLGVGGYLTALRRTQIGKYRVEEAKPLDDWLQEIEKTPC